ncbi:jg23004 [Pararge aegeria aegeria]|uniref:Jg23004 protein n=1 Tax=Pararge aegeria aegeria TaxID=348720 RepID=A0A8S4QQP5_9NEOP|nr:jg23004 [Pararge aegeria aegeria]
MPRGSAARPPADSFTCSMLITTYSSVIDSEFEKTTGLKQGDALSPLLFNLVLEYVTRKVIECYNSVELNGCHKAIGYADDSLGKQKAEEESMVETPELPDVEIDTRIQNALRCLADLRKVLPSEGRNQYCGRNHTGATQLACAPREDRGGSCSSFHYENVLLDVPGIDGSMKPVKTHTPSEKPIGGEWRRIGANGKFWCRRP